MNILTSDNPEQTSIDLDRKGSYKVGDLVRVTNRYGPAYCRRADGTGSSWELVAGSVWTVAKKIDGIDKDRYDLDDRNRPDVEGDDPCFVAYGVAGVNLEPAEDN